MNKTIEVRKFPQEGPYLVIIWIIFLIGGPLAIAAFSMSKAFSAIWLGVVGGVVAYTLVSYRVQFNQDFIFERKLIFGLIPISSKVIASRKEVIAVRLITSNGPTHEDGSPFLNNHNLSIVLRSGLLITVQIYNSSPEKEPKETIEKSRELAHSLGLSFEHRLEC